VTAPSSESTDATGSKSSAAEEKARRQAKLDEAEKRDRARREKAARAAEGAGGSKVDDAPEALPEERVVAVPVSYDQSGVAADPVPELEVEADGAVVAEATETIAHEEL
jgi:protein disulfide-isomerase A6